MEQAKETKNVNMYIGCLVNSDLQNTRQGKWKIGDHVSCPANHPDGVIWTKLFLKSISFFNI